MIMHALRGAIGLLMVTFFFSPALAAVDLDGWRIMGIAPSEGVAVARSPQGELRLVRSGDRIGERTTVTGFDGDRLVLEQPGEWGRVTLLVGVVDGRQVVDRRERQPLRRADVTGEPAQVVVERDR